MDARPIKYPQSNAQALFDRPIIIIGCNRSGTTLLFNNLSAHPSTWSLYVESQRTFHKHYPVDPDNGERVDAPANAKVRSTILRELFELAHSKEYFQQYPRLRRVPTKLFQRPLGRIYKRAPLRLVEKTPANSLRIPLMVALFPDARFIHLVRRGEDVVSSLMEGWQFWSRTARRPWRYSKWHYLVPPGWRDWVGRKLQEICAFQWSESNRYALTDLKAVPPERRMLVRHEDIMSDPVAMYRQILDFCELDYPPRFENLIRHIDRRVFTTGGSRPTKDKWRKLHNGEIESVSDFIAPINERLYTSGHY